MSGKDYVKTRLVEQIKWYDGKSVKNKRLCIACQMCIFLLAAGLIYIGYFGNIPLWIVGLIGVLLMLIESVDALFKFKEKWINYRTTAESLKHEKNLYDNKAGVYSKEGADKLVVERVEALISKENSYWENLNN
jgi:hypothetical protein